MRLFVAFILALLWANPAFTCMGPTWEDHHYPSCTTPLRSAEDRVVYIPGHYGDALSDHHVGAPEVQTRITYIEIAPNDAQHFIVLGSGLQTIWDFRGDIDSISKVIVLGSVRFGPHVAGVIGVPADKVVFTNPDLSLMDDILNTSCTRISKACTGAQLFGDEYDKRVTFYPAPTQAAIQVDAQIDVHGLRLGQTSDEPITIKMPDNPDQLVAIDPAVVVSPNTTSPYTQLPGQPGLDALVAEGALIAIDRAPDHPLIQAYSAAFSAKYRSRFDPDFTFIPKVNYIVTRAVKLPPELRPTAFLTAPGVPEPDMNGNHGYTACYFTSDPPTADSTASGLNSPLCLENSISRAVPEADQATLRAAARFDKAPFGNSACPIAALSDDTHVAVLALNDGDVRRYRDDPPGTINIAVSRDGPVALFVAINNSRSHWNITGDQVTHVFTDRPQISTVSLNGAPFEVTGLHNKADGCPNFAPYWVNNLGPAIAHLDAIFVDLTGQSIDELITGAGWTRKDGPALTFEISN